MLVCLSTGWFWQPSCCLLENIIRKSLCDNRARIFRAKKTLLRENTTTIVFFSREKANLLFLWCERCYHSLAPVFFIHKKAHGLVRLYENRFLLHAVRFLSRKGTITASLHCAVFFWRIYQWRLIGTDKWSWIVVRLGVSLTSGLINNYVKLLCNCRFWCFRLK